MSKSIVIRGFTDLPAAPEAIWRALQDRSVWADSLPGCDSFIQTGPNAFSASGRIQVGPLHAAVTATIAITPHDPRHETLRIDAKAAVGSLTLVADIILAEASSGTHLTYGATAVIVGRAAWFARQIGEDAIRQTIDDFFRRFATAIPSDEPVQAPVIAPITTPQPPRPKPRRYRTALWIGAGAATAIAVAATAILRHRSR